MLAPVVRIVFVALAAVLCMAPRLAHAAWPEKPIRVIVTAPPGGTIDALARAIAPGMSQALGQTVVVDNRGGASGLLGADLVAKAAPDGYTLLLTDGAALAINAAVRTDLPFSMAKDLVPLALVATTPSMLSAHPSLPATHLRELVALAKADPKRFAYAHPGPGTPHHLAGLLLARQAGIELNPIAYKGGGPMTADVVGGQVPLLITGTLATLPQVKGGKLKGLAIASRQRNPLLPDVPTFIEAGFPDFEAEVFFSFFTPAKVPPEVGPAVARALSKALADPDVRRRLEEQALVIVDGNADALRARFDRDGRKWGDLIRAANIALE